MEDIKQFNYDRLNGGINYKQVLLYCRFRLLGFVLLVLLRAQSLPTLNSIGGFNHVLSFISARRTSMNIVKLHHYWVVYV
jgi:hypothetical protein